MRCPSCNKFAAYTTDNEPEADLLFENEGFGGSVRIVLTGECCGDELKEYNFEVDAVVNLEDILAKLETTAKEREITLPEDFRKWTFEDEPEHLTCDGDVNFSGEITERRETTKTDAKGRVKPIAPRYQKTFYGFSGSVETTVTAKWKEGEETKTLDFLVVEDLEDEVQASSMDEMV